MYRKLQLCAQATGKNVLESLDKDSHVIFSFNLYSVVQERIFTVHVPMPCPVVKSMHP